MSHGVELDHVEMRFGTTVAVHEFSLNIQPGEFFSLLGPSGCGKTTVLRLVAGFLEPTSGVIRIGGEDQRGLPANRRPTAMIFQSLALFPLMPVWENVAFGLEVRGMPKPERRARAEKLLDLVALGGFADRRPDQLSGGQRQRVAIARALAVDPKVLLLDEPLSALDLKLRQHMRAELRAIQKRTGVTFLYITHDQGEALAMSDRVGVMSAGRLEQLGTPTDVYHRPSSPFVAEFVGLTNRLPATVSGGSADVLGVRLPLVDPSAPDGPAVALVRPEAVTPSGGVPDDEDGPLVGQVIATAFLGATSRITVDLGAAGTVLAQLTTADAAAYPAGSRARLSFRGDPVLVTRA
jgi:ABC-type Fe3+/spermidine/putrescine transport system ATPase subunit